MLSLARVKFDPFETEAVIRLQTELAKNDVELILDPTYIMKDTPILNYINPHIRLTDIKNILWQHLQSKFNVIVSRNVPISYMQTDGCPFTANSTLWYYSKPPVDTIPIFMVVHARDLYLKLTLNALTHSLAYDLDVPVHILMSKPTREVKEVVLSFKNKLNLSIYETDENVCFAGFNLLLQHVKPEKFMSLEEDFILPQNLKHIMPYWNRIFNERLNYFDVVGFSTSIENTSMDHFTMYNVSDTKNTFAYEWKNMKGSPHVTGNSLCTTREHYIRSSPQNGPFYITPDGVLMTKSKWSICSITGYHIGFNQEMDYGISLVQNSRFPNPENKQKLYDKQKNEIFEYQLTDIYK